MNGSTASPIGFVVALAALAGLATACAPPCSLSEQQGMDLLYFQFSDEQEPDAPLHVQLEVGLRRGTCRLQGGYDIEINGEHERRVEVGVAPIIGLNHLLPAAGEPAEDVQLAVTDGEVTWSATLPGLLVYRGFVPVGGAWEGPAGEDFLLQWQPATEMAGAVWYELCAQFEDGYCGYTESSPGDQPLQIPLPEMGMYDLRFEVQQQLSVSSCSGPPGCDQSVGGVTGRVLVGQGEEVYARP